MKQILLFLSLVCLYQMAFSAQDTSAYETQRTKINQLLAERSAKFGQYDESLITKTGIFGFKTKKDIRNSNEILRQIALNDNAIFQELKILLDYKDLQYNEVKTTADLTTASILNYRKTIKDLQQENQLALSELKKAESNAQIFKMLTLLLFLCTALLTYLFIKKK